KIIGIAWASGGLDGDRLATGRAVARGRFRLRVGRVAGDRHRKVIGVARASGGLDDDRLAGDRALRLALLDRRRRGGLDHRRRRTPPRGLSGSTLALALALVLGGLRLELLHDELQLVAKLAH